MRVLIVLTSHGQLGNTGHKTGFWLEELAAPYYVLTDAGVELTLASPQGGQPPLDPKSDEVDAQTADTRRFQADQVALEALAYTHKLSEVSVADFDAVFYPGGHGPLWDLVEDADSIALIETAIAAGKPVAAVCHAPAVLRDVRAPDGGPLVGQGRHRVHQHRGGCGPAHRRRAVPGRGHAQRQRREVLEGRGLAAPRRHRRAADHRSNPASSGPAAQALLKLLAASS